MGRYNVRKFKNVEKIKFTNESLKNLIIVLLISLLNIFIIHLFNRNQITEYNNKSLIFIFLIYSFISFLIQYLIKKIIYLYDINNSNLIYYGSKEIFETIYSYIRENKLNLKLTSIDSFDELLTRNYKIQGIIIENANNLSKYQRNKIKFLSKRGIPIFTLLSWCENFLEKLPIKLLDDEYVFGRNYFKIANYRELKLKRFGDVLMSIILLLVTSPIVLVASFAIYLEDKGPIFYSQYRSGYLQKNIKIWKLRTMRLDSEKDGLQWSKRNDSRITKVGKVLRIMRIDELPQLISVLKGDMSLIGPRPERPEIDEFLIKEIPFYDLRYSIRPGLSGWAQVNYPYGASIEDSEEKLSYDLYYLGNFSFLLDLAILFKTMKLVFNGKGAIANPHK
jgi:exopolysaccharide biosynthesis polyprenyl glycosylphosphotransferase